VTVLDHSGDQQSDIYTTQHKMMNDQRFDDSKMCVPD
jgi:hypothetical protein